MLILPQRQTVLVAKQASAVDVLSGGRLRLGVGVGWNDVEYESLNENFNNRGARADEQIEVMRKLWTEPALTFKGRWHTITDAGIKPLPVQRPIPVWVGGSSEAALRRAGRLGDGWFPQRPPDEQARTMVETIRQHARDAGRAPEVDRPGAGAEHRARARGRVGRLRRGLAAARRHAHLHSYHGRGVFIVAGAYRRIAARESGDRRQHTVEKRPVSWHKPATSYSMAEQRSTHDEDWDIGRRTTA